MEENSEGISPQGHPSKEEALKRGFLSEAKFRSAITAAIEQRKTPDWVTGFRQASMDENKQGIDWIILTDKGPIEIQIKSSKRGGQAGRAKIRKEQLGENRIVMVIDRQKTDEEIMARSLKRIKKRYRQL